MIIDVNVRDRITDLFIVVSKINTLMWSKYLVAYVSKYML